MLGTHPDPCEIKPAISGARGYPRRENSGLMALLAAVAAPSRERPRNCVGLGERELQVLQAIGEGKSNIEIGRELFLSENTIKVHGGRSSASSRSTIAPRLSRRASGTG